MLQKRKAAWIALISIAAACSAVSGAGADEQGAGPALTNINQIHALSAAEIERQPSARVEAVVSFQLPSRSLLWVQDDRAGIRLYIHGTNYPVQPGNRVLVTGKVVPGENCALLAPTEVTVLGKEKVPAALERTTRQLYTFEDLNRRVQVTGHVVQTINNGGRLQAELEAENHRVWLDFPVVSEESISQLTDATIRAQGICVSRVFDRGERVEPVLLIQGPTDVEVLKAGRPAVQAEPEDLPVQVISSLSQAAISTNDQLRVRVQGIVLDQRLREYAIIRDNTGTLRAESSEVFTLPLHERVDVSGILAWDGTSLYLHNATFSVTEPENVAAPTAAQNAAKPAELPVLTKAQEVRMLTPERADWKYPVQIRGVVTFYNRDRRLFFVQDETAGVYVNGPWSKAVFNPGDVVEISGITGRGNNAPMITPTNVATLSSAAIPDPRQATLLQLATGLYDGQWIEARGVVRSFSLQKGLLQLKVSDGDGTFIVNYPAARAPTNLVDAVIRVRGVCSTRFDDKRQVVGLALWSPSRQNIQIEEPGASDPLSLPTRSILSVSQQLSRDNLQRRVKVSGVVTLVKSAQCCFIQDAADGIQVLSSAEDEGLKPGDRVEVAGYPALGDFGSVLRDAVFRVVGHEAVPAAKLLAPQKALNPQWNNQRVELQARVTQVDRREVLTLQMPDWIFEARCQAPLSERETPAVGSLLRLTGVYQVLTDEFRSPNRFRIVFASGGDFQVLESPSWWSLKHTVAVVGLLAVVSTITTLWILMLRHKVQQQTASLREQVIRQTALEQSYRDIFEGANDLILAHDLDGRVTSLNPGAKRVLGYGDNEVNGLLIDHIFSPECRDLAHEMLELKSTGGHITNRECEFAAKDGRRIPVEVSARIALKDGKPYGVQAIARDISERKQTEIVLRESEGRYRRLVELSPLAMYVHCEGKIAFINQAALQLFGATRSEDLLGKPVLELVHPDYRESVDQRMSTPRDAGASVPLMDQKYLRLDGSIVDVEVAAVPFFLGQKPAAQVIVHDIGERKRAEEELFNSRQTLRTVLDTIPQRVFWKDRNSVFLGCNKAYAEDCGYPNPNELVGKTDYETISAATAELYRADDRHVLDTGVAKSNSEEPHVRRDGSQGWVRASKVPLFDKDGQAIGVLGTYEDITERKQADAALAEASNLLETMMANSPDYIYFKDRESRFVRHSDKFLKLLNLTSPNALKGKSDFDLFTEEHARPAYEDEQRIIQTGEPLVGKREKETHVDGHVSWVLTTKLPWRDKDGNIIGTFGISKDITAMKQAEDALAYERHLLKSLLDNSPDPIWFKDTQSRFLKSSHAQIAQFRVTSAEEMEGKTDFDFFSEEHARPAFEDEQEIIRSGRPIIGKIEKEVWADGHVTWAITNKMPLRNVQGEIIGTFGISKDVTAIKEAEAKVAYEQELFQTLLETIPDNIYFKDCESRLVRMSRSKVEGTLATARENYRATRPTEAADPWPPHLAGLEPFAEWLKGKTDFDTYPEEHARVAFEDEQEIIRTGQPIVGKLQKATFANGNSIWWLSTKLPWRDRDGKIVGTFGISKDVTAIQEAEHKLSYERDLFSALLNSSPDRIYFKDHESRFVRVSRSKALHAIEHAPQLRDRLQQLRGGADGQKAVPETELLNGLTDFDMFPDTHARMAQEEELNIIRTGQPLIGLVGKQTNTDGTSSWSLTNKLPWYDSAGKIIGTFGISKDITELKQAEDRLAQTSSLLETLLENSPDCIYFKDTQSRFVRFSKSFAALFHISDAEELKGKSDFDFFTEEHARPAFEDEQEIIRTGKPIVGKLEKETHPDGHVTWALTTKMPWRDKDGSAIGTFGISKDVTSIKETEEKLAQERALFRALVDNMPDSIYFKDLQSHFIRLSKYKVERSRLVLVKRYQEEHPDAKELPDYLTDADKCAVYLDGKTDFDVYGEERARKAFNEEQEIIRTGQPVIGRIEQGVRADDGRAAWFLTTKLPWQDEQGKVIGTFGVTRDISALKEAETQLELAHQRLIETSRLAGMAEVATDVLHNVGNVLNSVNVSCSLTMDRVKTSKMASLAKVSSLMTEHRGRLGEFFTSDPRGQQIPDYLAALAEHLTGEQKLLLKELEQLLKHIDHIKQIVAMQQSYAKVAGVLEPITPTQLVDDALHINAAALTRHDVQVRREIEDTPQILTEKHKVLQILVNLIRNAKYALDDAKRTDKIMTLRVTNIEDDKVKIEVIDNGVGIPAENLTRIFSHGFTTRRNGHGFGLHSSALAVKELGGSLLAHSDGAGKGAVFTLILPKTPPAQSPKAV